MKILIIILLSILFGILMGVFGVLYYQDIKESDRRREETTRRIKEMQERLDYEKRQFYGSVQARHERD